MPKEICSVYFNDLELYESIKEISNGKLSATIVAACQDYVKKYQISPINAEKSQRDDKIDSLINMMNNSDYWNKIIPTLTEQQLKILESAAHSLEIKSSNMINFGKLRN